MSCHLYHEKSWIFFFSSKSKHQFKSTHIIFSSCLFLFFSSSFSFVFFFLSFIYSFPTVIWLALCISLLKMISYFPKTQCLQRIPSKLFIASNPSSYPLTCIEPQPIVIPSQKLSSFHWMKIIEKAQNHANALYLCDLSKLQMENHNKHTRIIIEDLMRVLTIQMQKSFFSSSINEFEKKHLFLCLNIYLKWVLDTK